MHDYCTCELNDFNNAVSTLDNISVAAELVYYRYLFGDKINIACQTFSVIYFNLDIAI
jgi:hypothetical protein